jgi:hypothetical protein
MIILIIILIFKLVRRVLQLDTFLWLFIRHLYESFSFHSMSIYLTSVQQVVMWIARAALMFRISILISFSVRAVKVFIAHNRELLRHGRIFLLVIRCIILDGALWLFWRGLLWFFSDNQLTRGD